MSTKKEVPVTVTATAIPDMEGKVSRGVDFNLKKEDLMLLILEGRKEAMEEVITGLQAEKEKLGKEFATQNTKFVNELNKDFMNAISKDLKDVAASYGLNGNSNGAALTASTNMMSIPLSYIEFQTQAIKNSTGSISGGTFIKGQLSMNLNIQLPCKVTYTLNLSMVGKSFLNKHKLFAEDPQVCKDSVAVRVKVGEQDISIDALKKLPAYAELEKTGKSFGEIATKLSEILTDYDLFCRNQHRAKASMIKEVLSTDAAGKALLANITQAAKGVKLLG